MNALSRLLVVGLVLSGSFARADDIPRVRDDVKRIVAELTSEKFWGRGYTKGGMAKAADYLEEKLVAAGLQPLAGASFRQPFTMPVRTFPGRMSLKIDGRELVPGEDFIVTPGSAGGKRSGELYGKTEDVFVDPANGSFMLTLANKLTWSVAKPGGTSTSVYVARDRYRGPITSYELDVEATDVADFRAENVAAVVKGTAHPEKYIFLTAHYDHLGGMGEKTYFPGANDNASGVALVLSLAKYFATHPQPYSIAFVFFAAEEAGLVGSKYFVEHPLVDLKKIRFVMNYDLVGTGETGAVVVNATEFPAEFATLTKLNAEGRHLPQIGSRGRAANSDHYWFAERGVPAFFLYTTGGTAAYHDIHDRAETLPLNKIDDLFALLLKFSRELSRE